MGKQFLFASECLGEDPERRIIFLQVPRVYNYVSSRVKSKYDEQKREI